MSLKEIRLSHSEQEFRPIGAWAKALSIPAKALLHHGAQGDLRLFTLPPANSDYYSVHEDFVGKAVPLPYEALPVSMHDQGVMGLILSNSDCARLSAGERLEQSLFGSLIHKQGVWGNVIEPIQGRLGSTLRPEGWRIAAYKKIPSAEGGIWSVHTPIPVKIRAVNIYIRDVDVENFIARLHSYRFIADVFDGGRFAEELPSYVSGKLNELITANRLFWRNYPEIDGAEKARRREAVRDSLNESFAPLCDKTVKVESLISFAADICDPTPLPRSQQLPNTSATPGLLALLTAAKLFWSAHCTRPQAHETYPSREAIMDFLRFIGLREANAASAGATLIRPEGVETPEQQPDWLTTIRKSRQGLRR